MARFFIERPIFAMVISIVITLLGLISAFNLPIAQYPQITPPQVTVYTMYTGSNAQVIDETVAQLIELQVNGVEDMVSMDSTSSDSGMYRMSVKFEMEKDGDIATVQTQNRVSQVESSLPDDVKNYGVSTYKASQDMSLVFSLTSEDNTYTRTFLKNYGSIYIVEDLKRVPGVGEVREFGADYAMRVWLKPDRMAQLKITTIDVDNAIKSQNIQAPAGTAGLLPSPSDQAFQYSLRAKGRLNDPVEFAKIIVKTESDGTYVRLGDIARVELTDQTYIFGSEADGNEGSGFGIMLNPDANALQSISECKAIIEKASEEFPPSVKYTIVVDTTEFVVASMNEVGRTFVEALVLVTLVIFIFLQNGRATLIPMLAVPVSLIGTFASFVVLGFSINTLTLFAMVLAIGLVVDDAIVVIEAIEYNMRANKLSAKAATIKAMSEVSNPIIAIAFVLTAVFVPVAFSGGTMGILYKQFALTIVVSIILSTIVALSLTPALCAKMLSSHGITAKKSFIGRAFRIFNIKFEEMLRGYTKILHKLLPKAKFSFIAVILLIVVFFGFYKITPTTFVPNEDQGYVIVSINLPEASSLARTQSLASNIAAQIREFPGVAHTMALSGFDILSGGTKPNSATMFLKLDRWEDRTTEDKKIGTIIKKIYGLGLYTPEATIQAFPPPSLPGIGAVGGFTMMLQDRVGSSPEEMAKVSRAFMDAAQARPEIGMISTSYRADTPGYEFEVDREKAERLGVPIGSVFVTLQTFFGGSQINDFNKFGRSYKVMMQAEQEFRNEIEGTRFFYVRSNTGAMVPLDSLIKPKEISAQQMIKRYNTFPAIMITGSPGEGYSSGQALTALEEVADQVLPHGFSFEWANLSREEKLSGDKAPILFSISLIFAFLCLAALYESWTIPIAIILSVPTALVGAFIFQYLAGLENSIYMQIGLIVLIALAAKNAILIIEYAQIRIERGMDMITATIEAARLRLRPIIMTSMTFALACIPLAIASGAGAAARNSMGTAVVGGMITTTLLGVFLIPMLFIAVEQTVAKIQGYFSSGEKSGEEQS
ncbi:multidrug efflux RND transporter permease subunit [Selenomonadales bacterium OttesenSCG-928-I06]|nr:multidrug efflux RND transporter permease subunit [Selenomonadales bacterium OttesenSCG-928-I06]